MVEAVCVEDGPPQSTFCCFPLRFHARAPHVARSRVAVAHDRVCAGRDWRSIDLVHDVRPQSSDKNWKHCSRHWSGRRGVWNCSRFETGARSYGERGIGHLDCIAGVAHRCDGDAVAEPISNATSLYGLPRRVPAAQRLGHRTSAVDRNRFAWRCVKFAGHRAISFRTINRNRVRMRASGHASYSSPDSKVEASAFELQPALARSVSIRTKDDTPI
jgi:hypothetical protein